MNALLQYAPVVRLFGMLLLEILGINIAGRLAVPAAMVSTKIACDLYRDRKPDIKIGGIAKMLPDFFKLQPVFTLVISVLFTVTIMAFHCPSWAIFVATSAMGLGQVLGESFLRS